jgi:NAD(P)-dependent dehydrogenase (short-subunit alcohol dehydrogenase family)
MIFNDLKNKKFVVIGASTGIGLNLSKTIADIGAEVIVGSSNPNEMHSKLDSNKNSFQIKKVDFKNTSSVEKFANDCSEVDGLAIVSGNTKVVPPHLISKKMLDNQLDFNLAIPIYVVSQMLKHKKLKSNSSIVFTSASARINQVPCTAPYAAAKLGLYGATRSLSADLAPKRIRVNCVSFDYVDTEMITNVKKIDETQILGVSEVSFTCLPYLFLLSERSRWMTGQIVAADSGRMLGKTRYV